MAPGPKKAEVFKLLKQAHDIENGIRKVFKIDGNKSNLISLEDPFGNTLTYDYDSENNRLLKILDSKREVNFQYDSERRLSSAILPTGDEIYYLYDPEGRLTKVHYPNGNSLSYGYDTDNRLVKVMDSYGNTLVENLYDDLGRLADQKVLGGGNYTFSHDLHTGRSLTRAPSGAQTGVEYDAKSRPVTLTNPLGNKSQIQYGAGNNRPTALADPLGNQFTLVYQGDYLNQLLLNDEPYLSLDYDGKGNVISMQDALGHTVAFEYDEQGNLIETTSATGITMKQGFDEFSRLTKYGRSVGELSQNSV